MLYIPSKLTHQQFLDKLPQKVIDQVNILGIYAGMKELILCRCKIHNREYSQLAGTLIVGKIVCPECIKDIANILDLCSAALNRYIRRGGCIKVQERICD